MIFKKVKVNNNLNTDLILYTENDISDYMFNHIMSVVDTTCMPQDLLDYNKIKFLPQNAIVSDRNVFIETKQTIRQKNRAKFYLKPKVI